MARARAPNASARANLVATAMAISRTGVQLIVTEARLLRTELREKMGRLGLGVALAAGGGVLLVLAVVLLFVALIGALIDAGFSLAIAALIVFAAALVIGGGCLWLGLRQLRLEKLMPKRTIEQVQKDFESITLETNE